MSFLTILVLIIAFAVAPRFMFGLLKVAVVLLLLAVVAFLILAGA